MKISEYPFEPRVSEAAKEKAKEALGILGSPISGRDGRTNFFVIGDDGKFEKNFNQGCHYYIGSHTSSKPANGQRCAVVTEGNGWNRRRELSRDLAKVFANYLTQFHHLGRFILNRDDIDECVDRGYVISADIPAPWLQNICIMTRHFYEVNAKSFKNFSDMLNAGIDPDVAYMVNMNVGSSVMATHPCGSAAIEDVVPVTSYNGHRATRLLPLNALRRFVLGETIKDFPTKYRDNVAYSGGSAMYDEKKIQPYDENMGSLIPSLMADESFRKDLSAYRKATGNNEVYRPPNPFSRSPKQARADDITNKEMREFVAPRLTELVKEWRNASPAETGGDGVNDSRAIAA